MKKESLNVGGLLARFLLSLLCALTAISLFFILLDFTKEEVTAYAEAGTGSYTHDETIFGDRATDPSHNGATPITASGTLASGNYYLASDVTISAAITTANSAIVNICLNGYVINYSGSAVISIFNVGEYSTLNIYDCCNDGAHKHYYTKDSDGMYVFDDTTVTPDYITGGLITGATRNAIYVNPSYYAYANLYGGTIAGNTSKNGYGGGIYCNKGTITMYNGDICGNYAIYGGGIYGNSYKFIMTGGRIYENVAQNYGGIYDYKSDGSFTFSGSAQVYDNVKTDGTINNVVVHSKFTIGAGGFNSDAYIGVTTSAANFNNGSFITNYSNYDDPDVLNEYIFLDSGTICNPHTYADTVVAPTCGAGGYTEHTCTNCGRTYRDTPTAALVHSYTDTVTPPTCTAGGYTTHTCANCGDTTTDTPTAATGHTIVADPAVAATCSATGLTAGDHCSTCSAVINPQSTIPMLSHTLVTDPAVAATCTTTGLTAGDHCSVCGTVTTPQTTIPMLSHTLVTDPAVAATCSATGLTAGDHCSVCSTVTTPQAVVPATGHTLISDPAVAAGCTTTGLTAGDHCSVCSTVTTPQAVVPATGHTLVADPAVAAGCTTTGLTAGDHCSVCSTVITPRSTVPATGHSYADTVTPPTCTTGGYTTHTCTICGDTYTDTVVPATGHTFTTYAYNGDATCTADGTETAVCDDCTATDTRTAVGTVTPHTFTTYVYNGDATCTADGTETSVCDDCTAIDTRTAAGTALGHDYTGVTPVWTWASNYFTATATFSCTRGDNPAMTMPATITTSSSTATCTTAGNAVFTATVILDGNTYTDSQNVSGTTLPHDYQITGWVWASDYTTATASYACTVCGDSGSATDFSTSQIIGITCTGSAYTEYTVTVTYPYLQTATDVQQVPIAATPHNLTPDWVWNGTAADLNMVCADCGDTIATIPATVTSVQNPDGSITYTAEVEHDGVKYTDTFTDPNAGGGGNGGGNGGGTTDPGDGDGSGGTDGDGFNWLLFISIALVVMDALLFIMLLVVLNKRRDDEDGYYDYYYDEEY